MDNDVLFKGKVGFTLKSMTTEKADFNPIFHPFHFYLQFHIKAILNTYLGIYILLYGNEVVLRY